jgi:hypothetical protein
MFIKLFKTWKKYKKEILFCIFIVTIIILAVSRIGQKGSWSSSYFYPGKFTNKEKKKGMRNSKKTPLSEKEYLNIPSPPPKKDSSGEIECRRVIENLFQKPFNKVRPNFLNNPVTGGNFNLELDCYNNELGIALEFNGAQHAKYTPYFHKNKEAFYNQKYRDYMKETMCRDNGIKLISVPHTVKNNDIENYIKKELKKFGYYF